MSKKLLALGMIIGLVAACGGNDNETEMNEGAGVETPAPAVMPADTMNMDTMGMDTMGMDTMPEPMTEQDSAGM